MTKHAIEQHTLASSPLRSGANGAIMATESLGAWLRRQRLQRRWTAAEMGRRVYRAAKAAGDNSVPSCAIVVSYVRRWEKDSLIPTERYKMYYCAALGIAPEQFGPLYPSLPVTASDRTQHDPSKSPADSIVVVIPDGCRQVLIHIPHAPAPGMPHVVIVRGAVTVTGDTAVNRSSGE